MTYDAGAREPAPPPARLVEAKSSADSLRAVAVLGASLAALLPARGPDAEVSSPPAHHPKGARA
jgi:hypothetical protein